MTEGNYKPWGHGNSITIGGITREYSTVKLDSLKILYYNNGNNANTKSFFDSDDLLVWEKPTGKNLVIIGIKCHSSGGENLTIGQSATIDTVSNTRALLSTHNFTSANEFAISPNHLVINKTYVAFTTSSTQTGLIILYGFEV